MYIGSIPAELLGGDVVVVEAPASPPQPHYQEPVVEAHTWEQYIEWVNDARYCLEQHIQDAARSIAEVMHSNSSYKQYSAHLRNGGRIKAHADTKAWILFNIHVCATTYGVPLPESIQAMCD